MVRRALIHDVVQGVISIVIVGAFCWSLAYAFMHGFPPARDGDQGMYLLLGSLGTALGTVLQSYFRPTDERVTDDAGNTRR